MLYYRTTESLRYSQCNLCANLDNFIFNSLHVKVHVIIVAARQMLVLYFVITIVAVQELNVFVKTSIAGEAGVTFCTW